MQVLKRREFAHWQGRQLLSDFGLCDAVREMEFGLIGVELGGLLYKKRVARPGGSKRDGFRAFVSTRLRGRYVFLHGFAKNDEANITDKERKALQAAGKILLELSPANTAKTLEAGVLVEVGCGQ